MTKAIQAPSAHTGAPGLRGAAGGHDDFYIPSLDGIRAAAFMPGVFASWRSESLCAGRTRRHYFLFSQRISDHDAAAYGGRKERVDQSIQVLFATCAADFSAHCISPLPGRGRWSTSGFLTDN